MFIAILFVAIGLFLQGTNSQTAPGTCTQAVNMPCIAYCNQSNVFLDISETFHYPLTAIDPDGIYSYTYQPYYGLDCNPTTNSPRSAICQTLLKEPDQKFSAGSMVYVDWYLQETNPYYFSVTYLLGDSNRTAIVHFKQDDTVDNPVFATFGEPSYREYVFEVRGKNIGQPTNLYFGKE